MDDNPGISLFQNSNFEEIKCNSPAPEELEAEQDQIRYRRELEQILETEFDDLADIGNSLVNSSYSASISALNNRSVEKESKNGKKSNDQYLTNDTSFNDTNRRRLKADHSDFKQLEVSYGVRLREIEQLRDENKNLKDRYEADKSEWSTALKQAITDKENTANSRNEIQKLLLETTNRLSEAEKELSHIRQKCLDSERIKSNALHELELCKITVRELEKRLLVAEKNSYQNEEKHFDNLLKELTSKHKREMSSLEKDIHNLNNQIKSKDIDYAKLEQQLMDMRRAHESTLNEKTRIINKLNENLTQCHSQYKTLRESSKNNDVTKISNELYQQKIENEILRREISSLKEKIVEYESVSKNNTRRESEPSKNKSNYPSASSMNSTMKLKEELQQMNTNLKTKRTEIKNLQDKLLACSKEVKSLKNTEAKYTSEIEMLKKENQSMSAELAQSQQEKEQLKIEVMDYVTKTDILHQEQLSELELACSKKVLELQAASSRKVLELEAKLQETEINVKENSIKVFSEEINRISAIYSNYFDNLSATLERLKIELEEKIMQTKQMNDKIGKLNSEIDKVYNKYLNTRKIAVGLKRVVEDRTRLLIQRNEQYLQTVQEIQKHLYAVLVGKGSDVDKLTELIETSTKKIVRIDDVLVNDEINAVMCDIDRKLSFLQKPDV